MSTSASSATASTTASSPSSSFLFHGVTNLGLGYAIAIALGLLVLLSALLLASYICCRSSSSFRSGSRNASPIVASAAGTRAGGSSTGLVLPRVIFVAEEDEDEESGDHRSSAATGLDQAIINSYPRFPFSAVNGGETVCSICLCEYREEETLRMMPDCRHYFHLPCIDEWLRLNASCPVCRTSPMPTPVSTPLSELVPLSHYAADRRRR